MYTIFILFFFYSMQFRRITKLQNSGIDEKFSSKEHFNEAIFREKIENYELLKLCKTAKMSDKQKLEILNSKLHKHSIKTGRLVNGGLFKSFLE